MIDITNVENFGLEDSKITGIVIQEFKVKGKDFDSMKAELKEIFEKYGLR
ncbi:hypothetical protein [Methanococcus sp. CF]